MRGGLGRGSGPGGDGGGCDKHVGGDKGGCGGDAVPLVLVPQGGCVQGQVQKVAEHEVGHPPQPRDGLRAGFRVEGSRFGV